MNTRFILPVATAASLHAFLFFSIGRGPTTPLVGPGCGLSARTRVAVDPEPPIPPDETVAEDSAPRGQPDVVRSPEPLPTREVLASDITVPIAPSSAPTVVSTQLIPSGPIGLPDGVGLNPGSQILSATLLDNPPRTRTQIAPVYPLEAKQYGRPGEVLVEFTVDESGAVLNPRVVRSNDPVFESNTLRAISKWRFEPGRKNGRAVRFRMAVPVQFSLNE